MPAPPKRRPKKAFVQFAIAAVIALVLGVGAIGLTIFVVGAVNTQNQQQLDEKAKEAEKAQQELARLKKEAEESQSQVVTATEVQAISDIAVGTPIEQAMITTTELPKGSRAASGSFSRASYVVGKVASSKIMAGETITEDKLFAAEGLIDLDKGKRAITIAIDPVGGLNGAIMPGSSVDVLTTIAQGGNEKDAMRITRTLLQNVRVISIGAPSANRMASSPSTPAAPALNSVTIEVTPDQAELLALANEQGKFHLTLRGFSDKDKAKVSGADVTRLISGGAGRSPDKVLPPPPAFNPTAEIPVNYSPDGGLPQPEAPGSTKETFKMEVFKGASSETKTFDKE